MGRFDEKIMLVTGATSGIGRAVAIRAAKEGATVVAVGRNEERGAAVVAAMEEAGGKGEFMKCDVSNKDAVKALFAEIQEKYGKLDVAVNNAGIVGASKTVEELEDDDWFQVIDANLNSCFFCCREEVKLMQPSGGAIVNVSSVAGMRGFPSAAAYVASKHAQWTDKSRWQWTMLQKELRVMRFALQEQILRLQREVQQILRREWQRLQHREKIRWNG